MASCLIRTNVSYTVSTGRLSLGRDPLRLITTFRRSGAEVAKPFAWSMTSAALGRANMKVLRGGDGDLRTGDGELGGVVGGVIGSVGASLIQEESLLNDSSILAMKLFNRGGDPWRGATMLTSSAWARLAEATKRSFLIGMFHG